MTAADESTEAAAPRAESAAGPDVPPPGTAHPRQPAGDNPAPGNDVLRWLAGVVANATVLTALLVFFGWKRSDVQARRLGINESILGMSTRDFVLRSVGPVLVLLSIIGVAGLLWVLVDHWLSRRVRAAGRADRVVRYTLRLLPLGWFALPALVWAMGFVWRPAAFIAWPFSIGAGVLLFLYAVHLRGMLPHAHPSVLPGRLHLLRTFTAIIVGVALFWGASNYAYVQGNSLADEFADHIRDQTQVVVYSPQRLHLTAPGITETPLSGDKSAYQYRYSGLRLLEHTGGRYFLVSDEWSPRYGVVIMLADNAPVRLEFLRDRR
jgi:hypothetical protein